MIAKAEYRGLNWYDILLLCVVKYLYSKRSGVDFKLNIYSITQKNVVVLSLTVVFVH